MATKWVPVTEFLKALDLTFPQLRVLVEGGYVVIGPRETGTTEDWSTWQVMAIDPVHSLSVHDPILRYRLRQRIKEARKRYPISRRRIMMWLMNVEMGDGTKPLPFDRMLELEVKRIARLKEPMRTEQAVRLLMRFRDAEAIVYGLEQASKERVKASIAKREAVGIMARLVIMAGMQKPENIRRRMEVRERINQIRENPPPLHFPVVYRPDPQASMPVPQILLPSPPASRPQPEDRRGSRRRTGRN